MINPNLYERLEQLFIDGMAAGYNDHNFLRKIGRKERQKMVDDYVSKAFYDLVNSKELQGEV